MSDAGEFCKECGKKLTGYDKPLTRKLINRGAKEFLCMDCLCGYFKVDKSVLEERIEYFKAGGCSLFR